jgi:hypothetical protein
MNSWSFSPSELPQPAWMPGVPSTAMTSSWSYLSQFLFGTPRPPLPATGSINSLLSADSSHPQPPHRLPGKGGSMVARGTESSDSVDSSRPSFFSIHRQLSDTIVGTTSSRAKAIAFSQSAEVAVTTVSSGSAALLSVSEEPATRSQRSSGGGEHPSTPQPRPPKGVRGTTLRAHSLHDGERYRFKQRNCALMRTLSLLRGSKQTRTRPPIALSVSREYVSFPLVRDSVRFRFVHRPSAVGGGTSQAAAQPRRGGNAGRAAQLGRIPHWPHGRGHPVNLERLSRSQGRFPEILIIFPRNTASRATESSVEQSTRQSVSKSSSAGIVFFFFFVSRTNTFLLPIFAFYLSRRTSSFS